ncbi:MAG: OmpW family outer membrane protein [Planctomycetota bacterium]
MFTKYFLRSLVLIGASFVFCLIALTTSFSLADEDYHNLIPPRRGEMLSLSLYDDEETPPHRLSFEQFSCNFLLGTFKLKQSESKIIDLNNNFKGTKEDFDDEIWVGGIKLDNVFVWPDSAKKTAHWFTTGFNIYAFKTDYSIPLTNGVISQTHQIDSSNLIIMLVLKIAPPQNKVRPYLSIGLGPAWTVIKDERTSQSGVNQPVLEHSRDLNATVAFEMALGIETYLGKHFYLSLEAKYLKLANQYDLFYDKSTKTFTTEIDTKYQGVVSSFGLGIRF